MIKVAALFKNEYLDMIENQYLIEDYIIGDIDPIEFDPNYMVRFDYDTLFTPEVKEYVKSIHKGKVKVYEEDPETGETISYNKEIPSDVYNQCLLVYKYIITDKLNRKLDIVTKSLLDKYSQTEASTFEMQVKEAKEYFEKGADADIHLIQTLAEKRGIPLPDLAAKIIEKNKEYRTMLGNIIARHQKDVAAIKNADTLDVMKEIALNNGIKLEIFKD